MWWQARGDNRDPGLLDETTTVLVSGDDSNAKDEVKRLLDALRWPIATGNFNIAVQVERS